MVGLNLPVVGGAARWTHARRAGQWVLLAVAAAIVVHGLLGPQIAPRNLATVLTSIHWRGLLVVALLAAGNLFCLSCPMVLARDAGRRLIQPRWQWPRRFRGKWLALALLIAILWAYESFDLWELPRATAWVVLAYFGVALVIDLTFKGAAFCRYVCPIGQFNFLSATMSPLEVRARSLTTCKSCRTADCLKGRRAPGTGRIERRGCELGLYLPAKVGNLDCTFCLDCVQACPHDNVVLAARTPALEWLAVGRRSAIGLVTKRTDLAAMAFVFTSAALISAFAMTAPSHALETWLALRLGAPSEALVLALIFASGIVVLPSSVIAAASLATRWTTKTDVPLRTVAASYVFALLPFGFAVWVAHYGFHFLTGLFTVVPVTQAAAIDLFGSAPLGEPAWRFVGMRAGGALPLQLGMVLLGSLGSAGLIRAITRRDHPGHAVIGAWPWFVLLAALTALAGWIFLQPMEMRGTMVS